MDLIAATTMLFLIIDPFGNLPVWTSVLRHLPKSRRVVVLWRELVIALIIMMTFLWSGESILNFLSLSPQAVSISGALILLIVSLKMIFPSPSSPIVAAGEEPFIVPLATPMLAGSSLLATLILLAQQDTERMFEWSLSVFIAWFISALILAGGEYIEKLVGEKFLKAIERLMGMLLLMIAVQMFMNGIEIFLQNI
ncbi:MarC family protein [Vibrio sp. WXL103]|uniref:MarC family protein n=1 Tax=unclassified Vibrio TaxID=2614977 RepID=UPI0030E546F8